MKYQIVVLNLALVLTAGAQNSWTNRYNGPGNAADKATAIAVDSNGNVFVTGSSDSGNASVSLDYATVKYSNDGLPLWTNRYDEGTAFSSDEPNAIAVDASGNAFVTGHSSRLTGGVNYGYVTIKFSSAGVPLWTNRYDGPATGGYDSARAIALDTNGNVYVTGGSSAGGHRDYATIKYSNAGALLWINRFNGPGNSSDEAVAIAVDGNGNVFVTGTSYGSSQNNDFVTIAYSNGGTAMWTNRYSDQVYSNNIAYAIVVDGSGSVIVTGSSSGGAGNCYATIKYSNAGVPVWTNRYYGFNAYAKAIAVDGQGNVVVTGTSVTIKYSNAGVPLWTNNAPGKALALDSNDNVFIAYDSTLSWETRAYSNGGLPLWTNKFNGQGHSANALAVDGNGNVFVAGELGISGTGADFTTIKYPAISLPQAAVLENPELSSGEFLFDLVAEPNGQFFIQASTNLVDWSAIRQVTIPGGGRTNIAEVLAPGTGKTFYRAKRP